MRSNYRPLEFLICFSLTLCCLWSSTFIKSPMWLGWLIGTSWRLSPNAIAVCLLTFVFKDTRKAFSRTHFMWNSDNVYFVLFLCWQYHLAIILLYLITFYSYLCELTNDRTLQNSIIVILFSFSPSCSFQGLWEGCELRGGCTFVKVHSPVRESDSLTGECTLTSVFVNTHTHTNTQSHNYTPPPISSKGLKHIFSYLSFIYIC